MESQKQQKWTENPKLLERIFRYLHKFHPESLDTLNIDDKSKLMEHKKEILEQLAIFLVHPSLTVRKSTINFFFKNIYPKSHLLATEGNVIDELPQDLKQKVIDQMVHNYKSNNYNYLNFATFWLGMYGDEKSLPFLLKNLSHPSPVIVNQVINALGIFGSPRAIPFLLPMIHDPDLTIKTKESVIEAIGILGEEGVGIQSLIHELFTHDDVDYNFLKVYLKTHGARLLKYLACEIEYTKDSVRKSKLCEFYTRIAQDFSVMNSKKYNILL